MTVHSDMIYLTIGRREGQRGGGQATAGEGDALVQRDQEGGRGQER